MCGRYYIEDDDVQEELLKIIEEVQRRASASENPVALKAHGEIFPTDTVPVIANNRDMRPTPFAMQWGYTMPDGKRIINARSETAMEKPLFKDGMLQRRCLIPASGYYEWEKRDGKKIKYAIRPEGMRMLYMAGIYRIEKGLPVFSILTREVAPGIAFIHNRMPVILPESARKHWLDVHNPANEIIRQALLDMLFAVA